MGWLIFAAPAGEDSYLFGWLLSSNLSWYAMAICAVPAFFGKHKFSLMTLAGFIAGFIFGIIFGPNPSGEALGHGHYGWAIWGAAYLICAIAGMFIEHFVRQDVASLFSKIRRRRS